MSYWAHCRVLRSLGVAVPDRLTVGQQPLKLFILVRFQVRQSFVACAPQDLRYLFTRSTKALSSAERSEYLRPAYKREEVPEELGDEGQDFNEIQ